MNRKVIDGDSWIMILIVMENEYKIDMMLWPLVIDTIDFQDWGWSQSSAAVAHFPMLELQQ